MSWGGGNEDLSPIYNVRKTKAANACDQVNRRERKECTRLEYTSSTE